MRADQALFVVASASAGFGLCALALTLTAPPDLAPTALLARGTAQPAAQSAAPDTSWPALFGTPDAPSPTATAPVVQSTKYTLKGLISGPEGGWAIVAETDADHVVRPGTELPDGSVVTRITPEGVELERDTQTLRIGFADTDPSAPVLRPSADSMAAAGAAPGAHLSLRALRQMDLRKAFALAGGSEIVDLGEDAPALKITWIRNGRLYEQIGLRENDILVAINGIPAGDMDALNVAMPELLRARKYDLSVIRSGRRLTMEVIIDDDV